MYGIDGGADCIEFSGCLFLCSSLLIDCKREVGIFMINWLFYQQYCFTNACLQKRSEIRFFFCDGRIVGVAERA